MRRSASSRSLASSRLPLRPISQLTKRPKRPGRAQRRQAVDPRQPDHRPFERRKVRLVGVVGRNARSGQSARRSAVRFARDMPCSFSLFPGQASAVCRETGSRQAATVPGTQRPVRRSAGSDANGSVSNGCYGLLAGVRPAADTDYVRRIAPFSRWLRKRARTMAPSFLYRSVQSQIGDVKQISIPIDKKF